MYSESVTVIQPSKVTRGQFVTSQKSQGDNLLHPSPDTYLTVMLTKKSCEAKTPQSSHLYCTQSKTKVKSASLQSFYDNEERSSVIGNLF